MIQTDQDAFRQDLPGQEIRAMGRLEISLVLSADLVLISHLRMEGKIFLYQTKSPLRKHAHASFILQMAAPWSMKMSASLGPWSHHT